MRTGLFCFKLLGVLCAMLAAAGLLWGQAGTGAEPVRYTGGVIIEPTNHVHDGRLRPAVGVENIQVMRANRAHPEWGDDQGWTYNHAANLAYWNGRFYYHYLSNPVGEHVAPGQTLVATSADGRKWSKPVVVFPPYTLPEGGPAMMHQRMGFYVAPNGRLLVLAFHGRAPNPFGKGGIGRVVREAYKDGAYGPIYFIRYQRLGGFNETNTAYPFYNKSTDKGFVEACDALLANKLVTLNWWQEEQNNDDNFYAVTGSLQAFNYYHRKDGKVVGLWKWSLTALSEDQGQSWSKPVLTPTLKMAGAKIWGQRTSDNRYALVYNPINDGLHRWPLAVITGDDGILFDNMLTIHGEVPQRRFEGAAKDFGPQYTRGIAEYNPKSPGPDLWVAYSVNKEDMWITRLPIPVRGKVDRPVKDSFNNMRPGEAVTDWNIYGPQWAPVAVANFPSASNKSLELQDQDPYDYAKAVRVFPEGRSAKVSFRVYAKQSDTGQLEVEVLDAQGTRPVRLLFAGDARIKAANGGSLQNVAAYKPNTWYNVTLAVDATAGKYSVSIDGKRVLEQASFAEPVSSVERLSFRTGEYRTQPVREADRYKIADKTARYKMASVANPDEPVRPAVYYIDDVAAAAK